VGTSYGLSKINLSHSGKISAIKNYLNEPERENYGCVQNAICQLPSGNILVSVGEEIIEFNDFGNIHYNFLNKFGFLDSISETERESIKEDARQLLISDMKNKNYTLLAQGKTYQLNDINNLMEKIEYGEKDTETMIEISYRKLLLKKFIVNFKFSSNNLEEFKKDLIIKVEQHYGK
jgi:hypothetical protein